MDELFVYLLLTIPIFLLLLKKLEVEKLLPLSSDVNATATTTTATTTTEQDGGDKTATSSPVVTADSVVEKESPSPLISEAQAVVAVDEDNNSR